MDEDEQAPEVQPPFRRDVVFASIVCFVSSILFYWAARPVVSQIQAWWVKMLVYASIPISVTFFILYRSCWHPETMGAARTRSLLVFSCFILVGEIIAIGIMLCIAVLLVCIIAFCANAFSVTGGPG